MDARWSSWWKSRLTVHQKGERNARKWRPSRFHAQMGHRVQAFINTYAWMYACLCLATIKEHLNGKEKYRLTRADGGFGELPGCSLSIRSGGLGARTGVLKRDVQTHKKEGNQSGCAHGGACVCVSWSKRGFKHDTTVYSQYVTVQHLQGHWCTKKMWLCDVLIGRREKCHFQSQKAWIWTGFCDCSEIFFLQKIWSAGWLQRDQMTNAGRRLLVFCSFLFFNTQYYLWNIGKQ